MPTAGGVFLFVDQMRTGSPDSPLLPVFCILIMVRSHYSRPPLRFESVAVPMPQHGLVIDRVVMKQVQCGLFLGGRPWQNATAPTTHRHDSLVYD